MAQPRLWLLVAAAVALGGCARDAVAPGSTTEAPGPPVLVTRPADQLTFLRPAADAPAIANPVVSFYAKVDTDRRVEMYYRPRAGSSDSTRFLRFRVRKESLARRPDGTRFARGDSVLITITLADPSRLIVDFQPKGLRFSSEEPAELDIKYLETDPDLNGDGVVDAADVQLVSSFRIWHADDPGLVWKAEPSEVREDLHEVSARVTGFSGYAVAY